MKKYKKHIAIVLFLAVANLLAFTRLHAQDSTVSRLGDETTISIIGNKATIECENETIYNILISKFRSIIVNRVISLKTDSKHSFEKAYIFLNRHDAEIIKAWAKTNL